MFLEMSVGPTVQPTACFWLLQFCFSLRGSHDGEKETTLSRSDVPALWNLKRDDLERVVGVRCDFFLFFVRPSSLFIFLRQ